MKMSLWDVLTLVINIVNKIGPKTDPCGAPLDTFSVADLRLSE